MRRPDASKGCDNDASTLWATEMQACSSATSLSRIRNSSPPTRATVSQSRASSRRRDAALRITTSPTACPNESLMGLNPSRSTNSTAMRSTTPSWLLRSSRRVAWARRSSNSRRLGSPVNGSAKARCWSSSLAACRRALLSCMECDAPRAARCSLESRMDVSKVTTSSAPAIIATAVCRPGPPSSPAVRQTEPAAKLAAAMPR